MNIMIAIFLLSGSFAIMFSLFLIFFPTDLKKSNDYLNRILFTDENAIVYRKRTGWILILLSMAIFYIYQLFLR